MLKSDIMKKVHNINIHVCNRATYYKIILKIIKALIKIRYDSVPKDQQHNKSNASSA